MAVSGHDRPVLRIRVVVLPVRTGGISATEALSGSFSTEVGHTRDVGRCRSLSRGSLGTWDIAFDLVNDLGQPWTVRQPTKQLQRLGVEYRADRGTRFGRLVRRAQEFRGDCQSARTMGEKHIPVDRQSAQCAFE